MTKVYTTTVSSFALVRIFSERHDLLFIKTVIPVTSTKAVDTTVEVTVGSSQTVSAYTTYVVTQNGTTFYTTKSLQPTTVPIATTRTTSLGATTVTSSAPTGVVTAAATSQNRPAAAFLAGIFGLLALF